MSVWPTSSGISTWESLEMEGCSIDIVEPSGYYFWGKKILQKENYVYKCQGIQLIISNRRFL